MGWVYNFGTNIVHNIPVLAAKVASVILIIFGIGMAAGYMFALEGYNFLVLLIPLAAVGLMWEKLDEGTILFIGLIIIALLFPELFI